MDAVQIHEYNVKMTCEGCTGAVKRVLERLKGNGVEDYSINYEEQKVEVRSSLSADEILLTIRKTGKEVKYISSHN